MRNHWHTEDPLSCPALTTLGMLNGKWKPMILHMLSEGTMRFGDLKRNISPVSHKVLTQQLRELEADGLIRRTIHAEMPPKVEYDLTEKGSSLTTVLDILYAWGMEHGAAQATPG